MDLSDRIDEISCISRPVTAAMGLVEPNEPMGTVDKLQNKCSSAGIKKKKTKYQRKLPWYTGNLFIVVTGETREVFLDYASYCQLRRR